MPQLHARSSSFAIEIKLTLAAIPTLAALLLGATACAGSDAPSRAAPPTTPADPAAPAAPAGDDAISPALAARLQRAAATYQQWGRVDERPALAPEMCAAPTDARARPAQLRRSAAEGGGHGHKLYYLWASDRALYLRRPRGDEPERPARIPAGFTIVKQSFAAEPATTVEDPHAAVRLPDGSALIAGAAADLFVMIKLTGEAGAEPAAGDASTDAGWIYGTVAPSGRVTSAGRVASCMRCHQRVEDRLFGLPAE